MKTKMIFRTLILLLITGCSGTSDLPAEKKAWKPLLQIQAGANKGGVTENNDFTSTPEVPVDGFTGATRAGFNIGAHVMLPVRNNAFETGIDYMYNAQFFTYNDAVNGYSGKRDMATSQFLFPVTCDIGLFRLKSNQPLFYFKLGYVFELNLLSVDDHGVSLPAYGYNLWSNGVTFGVATTAFRLNNGAHLGFYLDGYRGTKIYNDFYNSDVYETPGSSYYKIGLIYQFK